jgi:hypothetical protein
LLDRAPLPTAVPISTTTFAQQNRRNNNGKISVQIF